MSRLLPGVVGSALLLAIGLVGCGVTSTGTTSYAPLTAASPSATSGEPTATSGVSSTPAGVPSSALQLTCVLQGTVHPIDTVSESLHCTVTHAASSETGFVLHYTVSDNVGPHTLSPACQGALSGGSGSCSITYSVVVPFSLAKGTVSGATEPNEYPLGPVVPTQAYGTPTGTPILPYITPTVLGVPIG